MKHLNKNIEGVDEIINEKLSMNQTLYCSVLQDHDCSSFIIKNNSENIKI